MLGLVNEKLLSKLTEENKEKDAMLIEDEMPLDHTLSNAKNLLVSKLHHKFVILMFYFADKGINSDQKSKDDIQKIIKTNDIPEKTQLVGEQLSVVRI